MKNTYKSLDELEVTSDRDFNIQTAQYELYKAKKYGKMRDVLTAEINLLKAKEEISICIDSKDIVEKIFSEVEHTRITLLLLYKKSNGKVFKCFAEYFEDLYNALLSIRNKYPLFSNTKIMEIVDRAYEINKELQKNIFILDSIENSFNDKLKVLEKLKITDFLWETIITLKGQFSYVMHHEMYYITGRFINKKKQESKGIAKERVRKSIKGRYRKIIKKIKTLFIPYTIIEIRKTNVTIFGNNESEISKFLLEYKDDFYSKVFTRNRIRVLS